MKSLYHSNLIISAFFALSSLLLSSKVEAQNPNFLEHNWYFGDSPYGILFSKGNNQADTISNQNTTFGYGLGGGAVATDRQSGELLFYTDGNNVFDNSHQQMPNGSGLNANTLGNQHAAVLPVPNQPNQYYIITNTGNGIASGSLFYSIVDMTQDGNGGSPEPVRGDVVSKNVNTTISNTSEAMLVFYTGNDPYRYWLSVQDFGTRNFRLYEILPGNTFTLRSTISVPFNITAGNFSMHRPTGKIAISPISTNTNVTILDFNPGAQSIAYDTVILNTGNTDASQYAIYDTEWSNDGNQLYVSRTGDGVTPGSVMKYDINQPQLSGQLVNPTGLFERSYGLKKGPDGNIYHLYRQTAGEGPFLLARINTVDSASTNDTNLAF